MMKLAFRWVTALILAETTCVLAWQILIAKTSPAPWVSWLSIWPWVALGNANQIVLSVTAACLAVFYIPIFHHAAPVRRMGVGVLFTLAWTAAYLAIVTPHKFVMPLITVAVTPGETPHFTIPQLPPPVTWPPFGTDYLSYINSSLAIFIALVLPGGYSRALRA